MAVIRPVGPSDRPAWERLWTGYHEFYGYVEPPTTYDRIFALLLHGHPTMQGRVAEVEGQLLGLVHYLFHDHFRNASGVTYLQDLFVDPAARGTGLGRALIEAVYAEADIAGRPQVYWLTQDFNATARNLYDRVGKLSPFIRYNRPS